MVVGALTMQLDIPAHSLKEKRSVIKGLIARLRNEFNVSVAEVDSLDAWQTAVIGVVCVSADQKYAQGLLNRVINWVETTRLDCALVDYHLELL